MRWDRITIRELAVASFGCYDSPGSDWGLPYGTIWGHQPVCHSCQVCDNHAKNIQLSHHIWGERAYIIGASGMQTLGPYGTTLTLTTSWIMVQEDHLNMCFYSFVCLLLPVVMNWCFRCWLCQIWLATCIKFTWQLCSRRSPSHCP